MACAFHYPDEDTPVYSYTPKDPVIDGSADPDVSGLEFQRTADGEPQANRTHTRRRRLRRRFRTSSKAKRDERDSFFDNTAGLPVRYIDETLDDYITVKMVGASVAGEWTPAENDLWERVEELEETTDMPNLDDIPGDTRAGSITIEDANAEGTVTFGTPYGDANYLVLSVQAFISSSGIPIACWPDLSSLAAEGFDVKLQMAPGTGESVRIDYLTSHL